MEKHRQIDNITSRSFDMSISVTQLKTGEIEVKDTLGVRLHLLNEEEQRGLWMYLNTMLDIRTTNINYI